MIAVARAWGGVGFVLAGLLGVSTAAAQAPGAEATVTATEVAANLGYTRGEGAESCPAAEALTAAVDRQLGHSVFDRTPVTHVLEVTVRRARGRFVARLSVGSAAGDALGSRELESRSGTCDELADALVLAIALALEPTPMSPAPSAPEPATPAAEPCPAATPCPEPAACPVCPPPPSTTTVAWKISVGAALGFGALPTTAPALIGNVALRLGATELQLEGVVYPEASTSVPATQLETQSQLARLGLCQWLLTGSDVEVAACAAAGFGVLRGGSPMALDRSLTYLVTGGVRALAELRLVGPVWLAARSDLHANLAGSTLSLGATKLWETPALVVELAFFASVRFL